MVACEAVGADLALLAVVFVDEGHRLLGNGVVLERYDIRPLVHGLLGMGDDDAEKRGDKDRGRKEGDISYAFSWLHGSIRWAIPVGLFYIFAFKFSHCLYFFISPS